MAADHCRREVSELASVSSVSCLTQLGLGGTHFKIRIGETKNDNSGCMKRGLFGRGSAVEPRVDVFDGYDALFAHGLSYRVKFRARGEVTYKDATSLLIDDSTLSMVCDFIETRLERVRKIPFSTPKNV